MKYILSSESWFSLSCYEGKILGPHESLRDLPMSVVSFSDWKDVERKKEYCILCQASLCHTST